VQDNAATPARYWDGDDSPWMGTEQMFQIAGVNANKDFIYNPIIRYNPYNSANGGVASYDLAWGRIDTTTSCAHSNGTRPYLFLQRLSLTPYDSEVSYGVLQTPISYPANGWNSGIFLATDGGGDLAPFYMTPAAQSTWGNTEAVLLREENWGDLVCAVPIVSYTRLHWFQMGGGGAYDLAWNESGTVGTVGPGNGNQYLYPSGLLADNEAADNLYVVYRNVAAAPYQYEMDKNDAATLNRDWQGVNVGNGVANLNWTLGNYHADLGQTADSIFVSLPWKDQDAGGNFIQGIDVSRIGKYHNGGNGVSTTRMTVRRALTDNNWNDCFLTSTLGADGSGVAQWHVCYYEDGLTQLQQTHFARPVDLPTNPAPLPINSAFRFQDISNTTNIQQELNPAAQFNFSGIQRNLSADQFEG
ncbi:MAG: hypothetical protein ACREBW_02705, partial [Candidatus Micrarchaeaceae archaeon]